MVNWPATAIAVFVVVLFGVALVSMSTGALRIAGLCFLSASVLMYVRETRFVDG